MKSILFLLTFTYFDEFGQNPQNKIITSDIILFWKCYDLLPTAKDREDSIRILQVEYINKVSNGLTAYFRYSMNNNNREIAEKYIYSLNQYPTYYKSIRNSTIDQSNNIKKIEKVVRRFKSVYPYLIQPKITLGVGFFGTGGTKVDSSNVFIGTEYYFTKTSNFKDFNGKPWFLNPKSTIHEATIHEMTHTNAIINDSTFLFTCIGEGAGVFMTSLIAGETSLTGPGGIPKTLLEFITKNKDSLFKDYKTDIFKVYKDSTLIRWYGGDEKLGYPKLLFYGLGYLICKDYYDNSSDKTKAIREIVTLKNYKNIWTESRIGQQ